MSISEPEKLKMETADMTAANIERIAGLFPNVITEIEDRNGSVRKGIDFDLLRQELSGDYVEGREERYDFTWVGKRQAIIEANWPIQKTLRPCIEESKDWKNTENVYIEGDNLDALKLLQESYLNKVKMIYIDPPYNTGNDFIYNDNFVMDSDEYDEETGAVDEYGNRRFKNNKERGRYHSDWCSMLYPRLKLAHNLLREDGVIFVSIDDNEVHNLRKMMDEIFGEENFISLFSVQLNPRGRHLDKFVAKTNEYVMTFGKNIDIVTTMYGIEKQGRMVDEYNREDENGKYRVLGLRNRNQAFNPTTRPNLYFPIYVNPSNGRVSITKDDDYTDEVWPNTPEGIKTCWTWGREKIADENNLLIGEKTGDEWRIYRKDYLLDDSGNIATTLPKSLWIDKEINNDYGRKSIRGLFERPLMDFPKSPDLVRKLLDIGASPNDIILDFFAGSSTTAHAVMQLNAEDGGHRKFIMVQLPEACGENSAAYKVGFKNISEIGKERIRRAGEQIKKEIEEENRQSKLDGEPKSVPDIGFRVFKIDETNMKDVYYSAAEYSQETIEGLVDNVKGDRTDLDLLYQVLINWGLPLDLKHEMEEINGFTIHIVDTDALIACFEPNISESVMRKIAERKPLRAVFRDGSFRSSPGKLNIEGIFKTIAPDTKLRVI